MKRPFLISLCLAAILSGCAVNNYELKEPNGLANEPTLSQLPWYAAIDDEQLSALINKALKTNEDIKIALNNLEAAKTLVTSANIAREPSINLNASANASKPKDSPTSKHLGLGANLSWQIDFWGKLSNEAQKAKLGEQTSELALAKAKDLIAFSVAKLYFQIAAGLYEQEILQNFKTLQSQQLKIHEHQMQLGAISKTDYLKLETDYQKLLIRLENSKAQSAKLFKAMGTLAFGLNEPRTFAITKNLPEMKMPSNFLSKTLLNRPDIASAALAVKMRHLDAKIARASFLPNFSLSLSEQAGSSNDFFANPITSLGINLLQPLFNLAGNKAALKRANLAQDSAVLSYEKSLKNAIKEIQSAMISYLNASKNLLAYEDVIKLENEIFNTAKTRYDEGETSLLEYLDAKRALLGSELEANNLRLLRLLSALDLYDASGIRYAPEVNASNLVADYAGASTEVKIKKLEGEDEDKIPSNN